jgi:hypothetical protein
MKIECCSVGRSLVGMSISIPTALLTAALVMGDGCFYGVISVDSFFVIRFLGVFRSL